MTRLMLAVDGGGDQQKHTKAVRGTGWAVLRYGLDTVPELIDGGLVQGGPDPWLDALTKVGSHDKEGVYEAARTVDEFVVENFVPLLPKVNAGPLEIVGMMKMFARTTGRPCRVQMPAQRLIISHDDLKAHGFWPGGAGHADQAQAIRHGLAALVLTGHKPTIELFAPDPG